jgi:hypothetical protein
MPPKNAAQSIREGFAAIHFVATFRLCRFAGGRPHRGDAGSATPGRFDPCSF